TISVRWCQTGCWPSCTRLPGLVDDRDAAVLGVDAEPGDVPLRQAQGHVQHGLGDAVRGDLLCRGPDALTYGLSRVPAEHLQRVVERVAHGHVVEDPALRLLVGRAAVLRDVTDLLDLLLAPECHAVLPSC